MQGLRNLDPTNKKKAKKVRNQCDTVQTVLPKPATSVSKPSAACDFSEEDLLSEGSSSSSADVPLVFVDDDHGAADLVPPGAGDEDHAGPLAPSDRVSRMLPFGPFSVSKIYSRGEHTGWGGNCGRHWDCACSLSCKKQIGAGTPVTPASLDEAHRLVKEWLLMGVSIPGTHCTSRSQHVRDVKRQHIRLRSHQDLDADAARLM